MISIDNAVRLICNASDYMYSKNFTPKFRAAILTISLSVFAGCGYISHCCKSTNGIVASVLGSVVVNTLLIVDALRHHNTFDRAAAAMNVQKLTLTENWKDIKNRDIYLILRCSYDYNGHFQRQLYTDQKCFGDNGVFIEVDSVDKICSVIKHITSQKNHILALCLLGHGDPDSITLGYPWDASRGRLDRSNVKCLRGALNLLDKEVPIILSSCSTGRINSAGTLSIAQMISDVAAPRPVVAPFQDYHIRRLFTKSGKFKPKLYQVRNGFKFAIMKLKQCLWSNKEDVVKIAAKRGILTDLTARFRAYPH